MSKYIKYISSDHFGAPVIKGDKFGYCVQMLRTCLTQGFNERTDLNKVEVVDANTVILTFATDHKYVATQTIKTSDITYPELNTELFIKSVDGLSITCTSYIDLTAFIGQSMTGITAKTIVAPLGFIEKFKDNNRSVFTTDEENAFLYIDDNDHPSGVGNIICPLVFMTDKMTDINTVVGKNIVPFDTANPTRYKEKNYTVSGSGAMSGIFNWITFGAKSASYPSNSAEDMQLPIKYSIIGNGRFFYFIPIVVCPINYKTIPFTSFIYGFGKVETIGKGAVKPYVLLASNTRTQDGAFRFERIALPRSVMPFSNKYLMQDALPTDLGTVFTGMLGVDGVPSELMFYQGNSLLTTTGYNIVFVSGGAGEFPNPYTKKYYVSRTNLYNKKMNKIGTMTGLMWTQNTSDMYFSNGNVSKLKYKGKSKYLYTYRDMASSTPALNMSDSTYNTFTYQISLDYNDWRNYE